MKKLMKLVGVLLALVLVAGAGAMVWASTGASSRLGKHYETHRLDFAVPMSLTEAELAALRAERVTPETPGADPLAGLDLNALAMDRARARGKHLVESIYPCIECHGSDFSGGTMMDAAPVARVFGANLTKGKGGVVGNYTRADWDRMVRHGVKPDGTPSPMPSGDFISMSDRELSDIVAYIESMPPKDNTVARPEFGPVGKLLLAKGDWPLDAERVDHQKPHAAERPDEADALAYGRHLANICTGCHRTDFTGGAIIGGPPDWAPAANLTPHPEGIAGYTLADFTRALREGKGRNQQSFKAPMDLMGKYGANMSDAEIGAMWAYLRTVPAKTSAR